MKTFREFIFDSYKPRLKNFSIILENFVIGNINIENFLYLLEGDFQSENAFRYIWNLASTDPELKDLLDRASTLLHGVDGPEPKKYVKKVSDEWKSWESEHKSLRDRIKEIRSSTELSKREKGRQIQRIEAEIKSHNDSQPNKYSLRKGSKEINPEWTRWDSSRSRNPEEDQRTAREIMSRISSIMRDRISAARNDPNNPLNFNNADSSDFTGGKTEEDSESYYDNLEANIDAVAISPSYRELRGKAGKWSAERTGNAQAELSRLARRGDVPQGYQPSPKNEGESNRDYANRIKREKKEYEQGITSPIQKSDATLIDPNNPLSYIGISHKKGSYQLSAGEPNELVAVGLSAAKEIASSEIQIPPRVKVTKELKDDIRRRQEERVEELMSSFRRIADITSYRGSDKSEVERRKKEAQSILNDLTEKEPAFIAAYTARQKTGEDRYASQTGTANIMVQVPDPKTSTEKNPQGTEITTTANRGAKKVITPSTSGHKGSGRPMTNRQRLPYAPETDIYAQQPTQPTQPTLLSFLKDAEKAQAQSEKALSKANKELEDANDELEVSSVPIDPDTGKPVLRQFRKNIEGHMAVDRTSRTSRLNNKRRRAAELRVTNAQANLDNAAAAHDANVNAVQQAQQQQASQETQPAPQQPQQAPQQVQQPQPTQQAPVEQPPAPQPTQQQPQQPKPQETPQEPQQVAQQSPQDETERRRDTRRRMDAAGASLGPENRAQIPPEDLENKKKKAKEILSRMNDASQQ